MLAEFLWLKYVKITQKRLNPDIEKIKSRYRSDIFENPNYYTDGPIEEDW